MFLTKKPSVLCMLGFFSKAHLCKCVSFNKRLKVVVHLELPTIFQIKF